MGKSKPWDGKWILGESLGEGGSGDVYEARRPDETVYSYALKQLRKKQDPAENLERRARMKNEVESLKKLRHKGIAEIIDDNLDSYPNLDVPLYMVTQKISGSSLEKKVENGGEPNLLSVRRSIEIADRILQALEYSHAHGVVHRDLKPENVLLDRLQPVLIDFGQAFIDSDTEANHETLTAQDMGNRFLVLPEQWNPLGTPEEKRDERSDITQVVGLIFWMLVGIRPANLGINEQSPHRRERSAKILKQHVIDIKLLGRINEMFDQGFQPSIKSRFQSIRELRTTLSHVLEPRQKPMLFCPSCGVKSEVQLQGTCSLTQEAGDQYGPEHEGDRIEYGACELYMCLNCFEPLVHVWTEYEDEEYDYEPRIVYPSRPLDPLTRNSRVPFEVKRLLKQADRCLLYRYDDAFFEVACKLIQTIRCHICMKNSLDFESNTIANLVQQNFISSDMGKQMELILARGGRYKFDFDDGPNNPPNFSQTERTHAWDVLKWIVTRFFEADVPPLEWK